MEHNTRGKRLSFAFAPVVICMMMAGVVSCFNSVRWIESVVEQGALVTVGEAAADVKGFFEPQRSNAELLVWSQEIAVQSRDEAQTWTEMLNRTWSGLKRAMGDLRQLSEGIAGAIRRVGVVNLSIAFSSVLLIITLIRLILGELEDRVRQRTAELEETSRTVQAQNKLLEAQNRRLTVERAVERVRSEVLSMRRPEDLQESVAVMRDELRRLGIESDPFRINVEEETGTPRLVVEWNPSEYLSFSEEEVGILEQFAEVVSMGYTRFLDLRAAKERSRQLAIERAVERVRAEATAMRTGNDMNSLVAATWREMVELGIETPGCSIIFIDEGTGLVNHYLALENPYEQGTRQSSPDLVVIDEETAVVRQGWTVDHVAANYSDPAYADMMRRWREGKPWSIAITFTDEQVTAFARSMGLPTMPPDWEGEWTVTNIPFQHGLVGIREHQRSDDHIETVWQLTQALSLGYLRFLDFQRLETQNRALEEANRQTQEANRAKSEFLARMSHELRTPLNSILGFTDLMRDGIFGEISEAFEEPLDEIQRSGNHLLELINDVLDLSKIEAGRMELHPSQCAIGGCIESVVGTIRPLAEEKGLRVITSIQEDLPTCTVDEGRITQVLLNLAGNAVKFTEEGEVEIGAREESDGLLVWVRDTGIGISSEKLEEIFGEFSQVDTVLTRKVEGTGLGLSISKRIVELHGGEIGVESEVGKGSRLWFRIPMEQGRGL